MSDISDELAALEAMFNESEKESTELYEKYRNMIVARNRIKIQLDEKKRELAELRKREKAEAEIQAAKDSILAIENQMFAISNQLDVLTASAPWRKAAHKFQIEAGHRAANAQGFILADSMGLGKSLMSIIACDMIGEVASIEGLLEKNNGLPEINPEVRYGQRILYITPKPTIDNVRKEFKLWAPHRTVLFLEAKNMFPLDIAEDLEQVVIVTNYEVWRKDKKIIDRLVKMAFDTIIIDEAHNMKNSTSVNFQTIERICQGEGPNYKGFPIPFRICMTGTPILNRPADIFPLLKLIAPLHFYSLNSFMYQYCDQRYVDGRLQWVFRVGGAQALMKKIGPYILRRTKEDVGLELPKLTIEEHKITPDKETYKEQWDVYEEMRKFGITYLNKVEQDDSKTVSATVIIALITRLRQICLWPAGVEIDKQVLEVFQSQKMDYLQELIDETVHHKDNNKDGERAVVFSQFSKPLIELKKRLTEQGYRVALMTGNTPDWERNDVISDLDARTAPLDYKYDIVLCNYKVGGVGLNFTAASTVFLLDSEWSTGKEDQAVGRLHRQGQELPVTVHKIIVEDTMDEWMERIIEAKAKMLEGFTSEVSTYQQLREMWNK